MRKFLITVLTLIPVLSFSQTISGKLLDKKNREPISYAHIYAEDFKLGTVSNELGEFELKLPGKNNECTIAISHISYTPVTVDVRTDTVLNVLLESDIFHLDSIVIGDKAYGIAKEVLATLEKAETGYGKALYRQITLQDTIPTEFIESFYHVAQSQQGVQQLAVDQARFARKKAQDTPWFTLINFSYLSVGLKIFSKKTSDVMIPFSPHHFDKYEFGIMDEYAKGAEHFVVVEFLPDESLPPGEEVAKLRGQFTFNTTRNTLVEYKAVVHHALGADNIKFEGEKKLTASDPVYRWTFSFSERNGVLGINFIRVEYHFNLGVDDVTFPTTVSSRMIFYEQSDKPHKKLREPGRALENVAIFEKAKYRPRFWKDNPVIKRTPAEEAIINSFEKENAFGSYFK